MKTSKGIIGLDLDGVIIDHAENKIKAAKLFGVEISMRDTPSDILKVKLGDKLSGAIHHKIYDDPTFALATSLMRGVAEGLRNIQNSKRPYFLVSKQKNHKIALENLRIHGLWGGYFDENNVYFVGSAEEKNKKMEELSVDICLDDQPSVLKKLSVAEKFLFDPFGAYPQHASYKVVSSWDEFMGHIL